MSAVIAIGLGHAIFPIVGCMMGKKKGLVIGAIVGGLIAIVLGPRYAVIDLIGVAVGVAVGLAMLKEAENEDELNSKWKL